MRHLHLVAAIVLALSWHARAQDISYERYTLGNGMTVILREDRTLPVAVVNLWYHVGAKDEPPGRSGFAHLFEHLMFMGTERVPGGDFDTIMEAGGGSNNASTSLDRTNYFSSGPASLLPTLLWLDADRLEDLGRTMTQEKLDKQRDVVRNEIRQNVENTPYGRASQEMYRLMYPPEHPYHNEVYGTHEDLEAATVHDVKDFFATYYVPRNASLVVAGDFDSAAIKPLINLLFGTLPAGNAVDHRTAPPVRLPGPIHRTQLDKVQLPMLKMVWHSPGYFAEGDAEMDLIGAVLSDGKNSRLYKRLVFDEPLAVEVAAHQLSASLGSLFEIAVIARPDADLGRIQEIVDEELARFREAGPREDELQERKATTEMAMLARLQSVLAIADKLNEYQHYFGEPNSFERDLNRYRKATHASVRDWAARVLVPERLVMRVLPAEPERGTTPRDQRPADLSRTVFEPRSPEAFSLDNGIQVMLWSKPELPLVAMNVVFTTQGPLHTPRTAGLPALTAKMLGEGAGDLDSLAFDSAIQALGATFDAGVEPEAAAISLTVLKRNFDRAAALAADAVRRPRLASTDWDRVRALHLEELRQQDDEPTIVAARVGLRRLFGDANPYAWPVDGTPRTIEALSLDDVKREHSRVFRPSSATILVAGDLTAQEARSTLEKAFGDWSPGEAVPPGPAADLAAPATGPMRVVIVDRPGAVQTVIRFVMPGPAFGNPLRTELRLLNAVLGGGFTSRLNQNLRETHGFTYGAGSRFAMQPSAGYFVASSSVRSDVTGAALKEFLAEFARLRSGDVSPDEAAKARETLRTDVIQTFEGLTGLLHAAGQLVVNGLPFATIGDDMRGMEGIDAAALNALARGAVPLEHGVLVLVGDKRLILEQLDGLPLPAPEEVNLWGEPTR